LEKPTPYNPLDKRNLGVSVTDALIASPVHPMPPEDAFVGAGIYAIYYVGAFPVYRAVSLPNRNEKFEVPIYVGKAVPAGARKGGLGLDVPAGTVLHNRLREHADTVGNAPSLRLQDFFCRCLVVDDIWIPLGESLLIERFTPVWNRIVDGFGNHDPGSGRYNQQRSAWDTLHPGRGWATRCRPYNRTKKQIVVAIENFLSADSDQ
jgi:hypothetical protein